MQRYEITFLTRAEDETAEVADLIAQLGGEIEFKTSSVRRKLAYPISHEQAAVYSTTLFMFPQEKLRDLDQKLERSDHVLRHLIIAGGIRKPLEEPQTSKPIEIEVPDSVVKGMAEFAAAEAAQVPPTQEEPTDIETKKTFGATEEHTEESASEKAISAEQVTADERQKKLDEKLKQILEG